jgi:ABC-2 type transport system permease protein
LLPQRPSWWLGVLLDVLVAGAADLVAHWARFQGLRLDTLLPGPWSTLPYLVAGQVAALALAGAYGRRPRIDWLIRVLAGAVIGTAVSAALLGAIRGFEGLSRSAFVADAVLLSVGAIGWRGAWVIRARRRARREHLIKGDFVDRAAEAVTVGGVFSNLYQYRELLKSLVLKDLKLKYRGSVFGFLWSLANPLLMTAVYTIGFTYILRIRSEGFVYYLLLGVLSWTFFANSAAMATGAIVDNAGLLKSVNFPRAILPIETVLFNLAQYLLTVLVFIPAMILWYQVPLTATMLLFPVFLALHVIFTIGAALFLATATAFFRDVRHLLEVALSVMFWTTPIVYELKQAPEQAQLLLLLSPVSPFIEAYHQLFFYRQWPEPTIWVLAGAHAIGAFLVGSLLFLAFEDRLMEQV